MKRLEPLIRKLRARTVLDDEDLAAIDRLPVQQKGIEAGTTIVRDGNRPGQCCLVLDGFAARSKQTASGKRQILSLHIPGDVPDLQGLHLHVMDHDLVALTACTMAFIPHEAMRALIRARPTVAEALWRDTLVDAAIFRDWIVNLGSRDAVSRMAHLIAELWERLKLVGLAPDNQFNLPLTQADLAEALGLSSVHVNRVLQTLRADGVFEFKRGAVRLLDVEKLVVMGDFSDLYLHRSPEL